MPPLDPASLALPAALTAHFPVSGVTTNILIPPLVAAVISFFTSMGGISGAFLLLPFQMSALNYTSPSVSGTNHVFNIVAIPSGVYRYIREGRMAWPLTWVIVAGTLPGVFLGYWLRVVFLPDPRIFKFFVGCVLLYVAYRLFRELLGTTGPRPAGVQTLHGTRPPQPQKQAGAAHAKYYQARVETLSVSLGKVEYAFCGERFSFSTAGMFALALLVGIIGGAYGIGGGSIIAPFCIAVFRLPVYTIAGAALMGTFITSLAGALFFTLLPPAGGAAALPDWPLGILFGIGGVLGMYLGARAQKHVPQRLIKLMLGIVILSVSLRYLLQII